MALYSFSPLDVLQGMMRNDRRRTGFHIQLETFSYQPLKHDRVRSCDPIPIRHSIYAALLIRDTPYGLPLSLYTLNVSPYRAAPLSSPICPSGSASFPSVVSFLFVLLSFYPS
ncbi:hypothetical protein VTN00DRAFT_7236 [Thermoascus crustaceus]|uniref:uncharacterized protein n=1 Tax=Thermoascus crustaceus TaxID=5088 RepID=UPI0037437734